MCNTVHVEYNIHLLKKYRLPGRRATSPKNIPHARPVRTRAAQRLERAAQRARAPHYCRLSVGPAGCGSRSRSNEILFFGVMIILAVRSRPRAHAALLYHSIRTVASYSYASPCSVSQRSHCLRSRPATPTAVFATAPAPEAANDSAAAASARRSSAEGIVADAAVSAACAERSKASRPSAIGPSCHWDLLSLALLKNNGLEPQSPSANLQLLLTADPARPLAARSAASAPPRVRH